MRILVVGAGATGGFYGGLLLRAGRDITFLLREGRAKQVRGHGLEIRLHTGEQLTLHPPVITTQELLRDRPTFDLVLISTKAYQFEQALTDIAPAVRPDTLLLPVLNGMRQITMLEDHFSPGQVLGGSVRIMSYLDEANRVVQMTSLDQFNYGELSGERTPRILAVEQAMEGCGFTAMLQPDILATLWQKWVILASLGAVCILAGGTVGQAAAVPHGKELGVSVIAECVAIARANGYPPPPELIAEHTARMVSTESDITTSLYRDMVAGSAVEADHIFGDLIARAGDIAVPLLKAAYVHLKVYEASR